MKNASKSPRDAKTKMPGLKTLLHQLVEESPNPAQFVELYYWSLEQELAQLMRHYIALPDEPRNVLRAFFAMTNENAETVRASVTQDGQVILSSPVVAEAMNTMATERVPDDKSESVH